MEDLELGLPDDRGAADRVIQLIFQVRALQRLAVRVQTDVHMCAQWVDQSSTDSKGKNTLARPAGLDAAESDS